MLVDLKERARVAAESTQLLETTVADRGLEIDTSAKNAIQQGGNMSKAEAKAVLNSQTSETVSNSETVDASDI
jgi:predicted component of type VI protein secretion system